MLRKPSKRPRLSEPSGGSVSSHKGDRQPLLRHVKHVVFSEYEIKGAFPSPYPFDDASVIEAASSLESRDSTSPNVKGKGKALQPPAPMVVVHTNGNGASTSSSADREPLSAQSSTNEDDQPAKPQAKRATEARNKKDKQPISKVVTERLFVCRGCFKYLLYEAAYAQHEKTCKFKHPPGRKVYQRGATIIWEVDGADAKLYCQNLCLFAKLFIEHKYVFYDTDGFLFYVLTQGVPSFDYVLAYFSKEKVSYDNYNLACIVTLPMYQNKAWATLLVEFSYELARRTTPDMPGTPERPLSESGKRTYVSYWTSVLVRFFRAVFEAKGEPPFLSDGDHLTAESGSVARKGKKSMKGWEGEPAGSRLARQSAPQQQQTAATPLSFASAPPASSRPLRSSAPAVPSPSASKRVKVVTGIDCEWAATIQDIARAVNLLPEDVMTALLESGMAQCRLEPDDHEDEEQDEEAEDEAQLSSSASLKIVVTPELVEEATRRIRYKPRMLDLACILL